MLANVSGGNDRFARVLASRLPGQAAGPTRPPISRTRVEMMSNT